MIAPWVHTVDGKELVDFRARLGGTSLIHSPRTYVVGTDRDVAYCKYPHEVPEALDNGPWRLVICGDERNFDGLSGLYETPTKYATEWEGAFRLLRDERARFSTKGLGMLDGSFDDEYHQRLLDLISAPVRAVNCTPWEWPAARKAIEARGGRWSVTIIPYRANWHPWEYNTVFAFLRQELFRPFKRALRQARDHPNVINVGIWCLKENYLGEPHNTWQSWHGIFDQRGEETWQARVVRDVASK